MLPHLRFISLAMPALFSTLLFVACKKELAEQEGTPDTITEESGAVCPQPNGNLPDFVVRHNAVAEGGYFSADQYVAIRSNTCFTRDLPEIPVFSDRAAGLKNGYWSPGTHLRVLFLNGSPALQQRVMSQAKQWENYANIRFRHVTAGPSDIRILFGDDGHWSYVGTGNRYVEGCEETMALELKDQTPDSEIRRVVLHEFGHVLGMRHEHQQPLAAIPWDAEKVYAFYAQHDWSREEVDEQILNKTSALTTQYTEFDGSSIMEYPVQASLTVNGYSIGWNTQLSAADKNFIGLMYSTTRIQVRHQAGSSARDITLQVAGIYHTLKPGEQLSVPALSGQNTVLLRPGGGTLTWSSGYASPGNNYKIVSGTGGKLILEKI